MGFNKVYKSLQEIFPQIDARVLRAVAIEHSKDVDAAVETVLAEIIPFFTERSGPRTPSAGGVSIGESSEGAIAATQTSDDTSVNAVGSTDDQNGYIVNVGNEQSFHDANNGQTEPCYDTYDGHDKGEGNTAELTLPGNILGDRVQTNINIYSHGEGEGEGEGNATELTFSGNILVNSMQTKSDVYSHGEADQFINKDGADVHRSEVSGDPITGGTISDAKYLESSTKAVSDDIDCHALGTSLDKDNGTNQNVDLLHGRVNSGHLETEFCRLTDKESDQMKFCGDGSYSVVGPASSTVHDPTSLSESSSQLPNMYGSGLEQLDVSFPDNTTSKMEAASTIVGYEDESTLNTSVSQSSQSNIIDVLEEIIADARNNKKTLFSSMQSVISLMKDVEFKEHAAAQSKVEAAMGGTDILVKSEELKQMVQQAKEANAMHAGEVHGEKAILATELRELQSRVLTLSDERDNSLAVIDEMQQTLEVRLAEAQDKIKSAEQEKIEKEKAAMKALAEQELIMETVVQESKTLKQQAEDNAKLREFLVDRGRVVDMLQGEIAVICKDVRLLKEKFDEHVPFSKSLSSSQTSCILASSTSSKSQEEALPDSSETQKERGMLFSSTQQSFGEEEAVRDDVRKALVDDGWELFDDREIYS